MLDLRRLTLLQRFASLGSINATAAEVGYSPSAVSQQLATLEREAGIALIERTAQSANLTDAGRELAEQATVILAAVETAESRMRARAGTISGRVDVSCIPGLATGLAPHLAALQREYAELEIVAHETETARAAAALLDRSSDVAVIDDWTEAPVAAATGLTVHRLGREQVVLAVPADHEAAARSGPVGALRLREIVTDETWLCAPPGQLSRAAGDERLAEADAHPSHRWEFEGLNVLARLVGTGSGVALLPESIAEDEPGVVGLPLRPRMYRYVHILTRSTTLQDPAIARCVSAVRDALDPRARGKVSS
jgi:DNA-binding transcriptional LysR family regulator